jgi:hypothetical protein
MGKRRIRLWGEALRFIKIEEDATIGGTIGENIYNEDGTLFDPDTVIVTLGPVDNSRYTAIWKYILEIPAIIKSIALITKPGYLYHDGSLTVVPHEWPLHDVRVEVDEALVIPDNKQYLIWYSIEIEGSVTVEAGGQLIILGEGLPEPTGPDMTYVSGVLTQIDYDGGEQKLFSYDGGGQLTVIDYIADGLTNRKSLFYGVGGELDYITESYV